MSLRVTIAFATLALLKAACADASTILFNNLVEPGDQYGPAPVGIGHTTAYTNPGDYNLYGVPFSPGTTAQLSTIKTPLGVFSGPNQIQAFLMSDSGGAPGSIIESFLLSGLPGSPSPFSLFTINSSLDPLLLAGTRYWFIATGGPNTFAAWTLNSNQGVNYLEAFQSVMGGVTGPWTTSTNNNIEGALQVFGNPVPEPAPGALACSGLLALMALRKRHRITLLRAKRV